MRGVVLRDDRGDVSPLVADAERVRRCAWTLHAVEQLEFEDL